MKGLTDRQRIFAENLAKGMTQGDAYMASGYAIKNEKTAAEAACRLAKNVKVSTYVDELRAKAREDTLLTIEEKRRFLANLLRADLTDAINAQNGNMEIPEGMGVLIQALDVDEKINEKGDTWGFTKKIKLMDKLKAMDLDNKMAGHYEPEKIEVTGSIVERIRERNKKRR